MMDFEWDEIISIEEVGEDECYDITLLEDNVYLDEPNFIIDDVVVHNCGMDAQYCKRKKWTLNRDDPDGSPWSVHPLMESILGKTYGVMVFQEQIMEILRVVGGIPDMHTEKIRKAISKKKLSQFIKYKDMFIQNGMRNLGVNEDFVQDLWQQVEAFSEYGFNKTVDQDTIIPMPDGFKKIRDFQRGDKVYCINELGNTVETEVLNLHDHGVMNGYTVTFDDGYEITCTLDHKFLTEQGQIPLWKILADNLTVLSDREYGENYAKAKEKWLEIEMWEGFCYQEETGATSESLSKVSGIMLRNRRMEGSLRNGIFSEISIDETSAKLSEMSRIGLGWEESQSSVRDCISNFEREGSAPSGMRRVRTDKEKKYQGKELENKSFQWTSKSIINSCKKNIVSSRNSGSACFAIKKLERRKSREICQMYRSSTKVFNQEIKNGTMVEEGIGLERCSNSMWKRKKASGFCQRENLDRNRWLLSFFQQRQSKFTKCSAKGRYVEGRVFEKEGYNADSNRHDMFCKQYRVNENGMVDYVPEYAPISETGHLASRKIVRVCSVGKRQMYDLEVANPTHNFLLENGVVTSNSHSYAYSYISARLLWLKAHYPLEFYTAIMMCESDDDKFREYKLDAKYHGVSIKPVDINKSKVNFHIDGDDIYFGFKNIKKIGEAVAERIVTNQPYESFRDFLDRFGTDATPLKALCAIGVFDTLEPDYTHIQLRQFHEFYKDHLKKIMDREKRFEASLTRKNMELRDLLLSQIPEEDLDFESLCSFSEESQSFWEEKFAGVEREVEYKSKGEIKTKAVSFVKLLQSLASKRETSIRGNQEKNKLDKECPVSMDRVNYKNIKLEVEEQALLMDSQELNGEVTYPRAESEYYGFQWVHVLDTCVNYTGQTIDHFLDQTENNPDYKGQPGPIEVLINSVRKRTSRKGTEFYSVDIEDANARQMTINVWMDDYTRWRDEIKKGSLLRIRVRPPSGGFNTLTFASVPKHERKNLPPKEDDYRVQRLLLPEKPKEEVNLEEFIFDEKALELL